MSDATQTPEETTPDFTAPGFGWGFWITMVVVFLLLRLVMGAWGLLGVGAIAGGWYCINLLRAGHEGPGPVLGAIASGLVLAALIFGSVLVALGGTGKWAGTGVSSFDECIRDYSIPAVTQIGTRQAYGLCRRIDEGKDDGRSACLLPLIRSASNPQAVQAAVRHCSP